MSETLYRRGPEGVMEAVVPEGRGRGEALRTYLARGGGLVERSKRTKRGGSDTTESFAPVYKSGPMKGKTMQEATSMFEDRWAKVSDKVKDKYASRSRDILSPSEQESQVSAPKKDMSPAAVQKRRMAQHGYEFDASGNAVKINRTGNNVPGKSTVAQGPAKPIAAKPKATATVQPPAPGSDEARAAALTETSRNERLNTADASGAMGMRSALALDASRGNYDPDLVATRGEAKTRDAVIEKEKTVAAQAIGADMRNKSATDKVAAERAALNLPSPSNAPAVVGAPGPFSNSKRRGGTSPSGIAGRASTGASPSAPVEVRNQVAASAKVAPIMPDQVAKAPPAQQSTTVQPPRINSLTGLPMGAGPGETAGLTPEQKATAARMAGERAAQGAPVASQGDIVSAQRTMERDGVTPMGSLTSGAPRATVVSPPTVRPPTVEQRAAAEMRRQAGINANPGTVNPDDPKKFFTGKVKPLDQLVRTQRIQAPVRR